ncbi:MAG: hypothetical protein HYT72_00150 [Candidatus Aenigmarchaeota archaeon]|nr:hypothetical protein [Candidatus Aenigmarchaeota archaeon]
MVKSKRKQYKDLEDRALFFYGVVLGGIFGFLGNIFANIIWEQIKTNPNMQFAYSFIFWVFLSIGTYKIYQFRGKFIKSKLLGIILIAIGVVYLSGFFLFTSAIKDILTLPISFFPIALGFCIWKSSKQTR